MNIAKLSDNVKVETPYLSKILRKKFVCRVSKQVYRKVWIHIKGVSKANINSEILICVDWATFEISL